MRNRGHVCTAGMQCGSEIYNEQVPPLEVQLQMSGFLRGVEELHVTAENVIVETGSHGSWTAL